MADYTELGGRTLKDVGQALTGEGLGVALGLLGAGFVGRQVQNRVKTDAEVAAAPTITNYAYAWGGNNIPKLAIWYLLRKYATSEVTIDAKKAVAGSVVFDTLMRIFNNGQNPATAIVGGYEVLGNGGETIHGAGAGTTANDIQNLIQENSALRGELNKAVDKLAAAGIPIALPDGPVKRRQRFGTMDEEALQTPRQRRFGIMKDSGLTDLTARFGML